MPNIPQGRADQLGDLVRMLELGESILTRARGSPSSTSATASATRVFPAPVGPRNRVVPRGLVGHDIPARKIWNRSLIRINRVVLAHDALAQFSPEFLRSSALLRQIQNDLAGRPRRRNLLVSFRQMSLRPHAGRLEDYWFGARFRTLPESNIGRSCEM